MFHRSWSSAGWVPAEPFGWGLLASSHSTTVTKTFWPKQPEEVRKGFPGLHLQVRIHQRWEWGQTLEKALKEGCLFTLIPSIQHHLSSRWHCPQWTGTSYTNTIKTVPHKHAHRPVWWRPFFSWDSLFPIGTGTQVDFTFWLLWIMLQWAYASLNLLSVGFLPFGHRHWSYMAELCYFYVFFRKFQLCSMVTWLPSFPTTVSKMSHLHFPSDVCQILIIYSLNFLQ